MDAKKPYDSEALADTVLRSSDNVYFYVLSALLRLVSPVFLDLFGLKANDENETRNGYPIVPLTEDSETIRLFLDFIYPSVDEPELSNGMLFVKVGKAADKYGVDIITGKLRKRLLCQEWMEKEPLQAYAIAVALGWKGEATTAARNVVSKPLPDVKYCKELELISGEHYYHLLEFRFRCEKLGVTPSQGGELCWGEATAGSAPSIGDQTDDTVEPRDAEKPFHPNIKADVILRSSDSIDFHVSQIMLSLVSPVFDTMFANPGDPETSNGLRIISVTEHSETLHQCLLMVYHVIDEPPINKLEVYTNVCLAIQKYQVRTIEGKLKKAFASSLMITSPLQAYAIAKILGWTDEMKKAAMNTFFKPLQEVVMNTPELRRITGGDIHRLVDYRLRCGNVAFAAVNTRHTHTLSGPEWFRNCIAPQSFQLFDTKPFSDADICEQVRSCPRGFTYRDAFDSELQRIRDYHKNNIGAKVSVVMMFRTLDCKDQLVSAIEHEISQVPFVAPARSAWMAL